MGQSRNEDILENMLGANNVLGEPQSRVEDLLQQILEQGGTGGGGTPGKDGFSPIATVTQTATGALISITDKNGETTATITNGEDGEGAELQKAEYSATITAGTQYTFTIPNYAVGNLVEAYLNGLRLAESEYTISNVGVFTLAATLTDDSNNIQIVHWHADHISNPYDDTGWETIGDAGAGIQYRKKNGVVFIRFSRNLETTSISVNVGTLPAGFRPTVGLIFTIGVWVNSGGWKPYSAIADIAATGVLTITQIPTEAQNVTSGSAVFRDMISFPV